MLLPFLIGVIIAMLPGAVLCACDLFSGATGSSTPLVYLDCGFIGVRLVAVGVAIGAAACQ